MENIPVLGLRKGLVETCPFCGSDSTVVRTRRFWVQCDNACCGAEGPVKEEEKDAIKAWNAVYRKDLHNPRDFSPPTPRLVEGPKRKRRRINLNC